MSFNFDRAYSKIKTALFLQRRADAQLPFFSADHRPSKLMLDTCVYIDHLQGKLPHTIQDYIFQKSGLIHHSSIAVQEMIFIAGRLDPEHSGTASVVAQVQTLIEAIPSHRTSVPDYDIMIHAGLLAGVLSRVQNYNQDSKIRSVNDSMMFLQAHKHGLTLLTRNIADYDLLLQIMPAARVLFYRAHHPT